MVYLFSSFKMGLCLRTSYYLWCSSDDNKLMSAKKVFIHKICEFLLYSRENSGVLSKYGMVVECWGFCYFPICFTEKLLVLRLLYFVLSYSHNAFRKLKWMMNSIFKIFFHLIKSMLLKWFTLWSHITNAISFGRRRIYKRSVEDCSNLSFLQHLKNFLMIFR